MSSEHALPTASAREYAAAYQMHYARRDLGAALTAYTEVILHHPGGPEADYARAQLRNIVRSVVGADDLLAREVEIAQGVLERRVTAAD